MYTQTEKVNIEPKSYLPVFRISQNDVGRTLKAHLVSDEGTITIPTSATVTMAGIKPSGLGYTVTGTFEGSDVTFETNATMTDEAGQIESEIRIVDGETLIGTTNVVLNVEPNPHPSDTTDGQREPLVNEITALLNQITAQADRVEEYSSKVLNMTVSAHESQEPTVTKTEGEVVNLDFGLPRGAKGERGERGEQGEAGKDGKDGIDGKDGKDGINGVTPDFSIGTVTTLEPTESASVTLTGTEEEPVLNFGIPRGAKGEQGDVSLSDLEKVMVTDTANGAIASFPDGSDLLPALSLVANIVPKQSGTGTPSPDNIRPISGWMEVDIKQCASLLRPSAPKTVVINGITFQSFGDGSYRVSGTSTAVAFCTVMPFESFEFPSDASYSIYLHNTVATADVSVYFANDNTWIDFWNCNSVNRVISLPQATLTDKSCNGIRIRVKENATVDMTIAPMISKAPTTHTTSLGRTVYGGEVDLVSGVLNVTHGIEVLNGTGNYGAYAVAENGSFYFIPSFYDGSNKIVPQSQISDYLPKGNSPQMTSRGIYTTAMGYFYINLFGTVSTLAECKSYLANNPLTVCYELATPTTYTLTPQTINTLSGVNNVWADSGDVTIEYYADTKLYIDKKLGGN